MVDLALATSVAGEMVGIGEVKALRGSPSVLVAYGLGSCVGVCLYDPLARVGGLAHVMLPSSGESLNNRSQTRFADTAVPRLLEEMTRLGASPRRVVAKIVGGAKMLTGPAFVLGFDIGARNVEAVKAALALSGVPLLASRVGGARGRTVTMHVGTGAVFVRAVGEREVEL